jgi:hypothetical protein
MVQHGVYGFHGRLYPSFYIFPVRYYALMRQRLGLVFYLLHRPLYVPLFLYFFIFLSYFALPASPLIFEFRMGGKYVVMEIFMGGSERVRCLCAYGLP